MKLVYVWVENYRNFIINQGFQITKDLIINVEYNEDDININIKENYGEALYKNNIVDISAIVGKNGSGKTSVATMILDYMPNNLIMNVDNIIYGDGNEQDEYRNVKSIYIFIDDNKKIKIFTRNIVDINVKINGYTDKEIKQKYDEIHNEDNSHYGQINMIYISNVFNIAELRDNYYERNTNVNGNQIQQMITPSFILKSCAEDYRKSFPYRATNNRYLIAIQQYAYNMSISTIQCYIKRQEDIFLNCYKNMSSDERNLLDIFNEYILEVGGFNTNNISIGINVNSDEDYKKNKQINKTIEDAHNMYINNKKKLTNNESMWLHIYILLLSEVYLGLGGSQNSLMIKIKEISLNNDKIKEIDIKMLLEIEEVLGNSELKNSEWYSEIIDCINQIKRYYFELKKQWNVGKRKFYQEKDKEDELINWYVGELKKKNSFFKRNMYFKQLPTSSGELAFVNLYAYIHEALNKIQENSSIVLVIDELDAYMHPEWQQMIINMLSKYLQRLDSYKFQIIITTHSPIILSDIPNKNIIFIKKDNNKIKLVNDNNIRTFGGNIYDLYRNSFFLNSNNYGVIGDFATHTINQVTHYLDSLNKDIDNINKENKQEKNDINIYGIMSDKHQLLDEKIKYCRKVISLIGEKFIKRSLMQLYNQVYSKLHYNDMNSDKEELEALKKSFNKLSKKEQDNLIKYIIDQRD